MASADRHNRLRFQTAKHTPVADHGTREVLCSSAEEHGAPDLLVQAGQLLHGDTARRGVLALTGGRLRHLFKLNELSDLGSSKMCVADGSNN